MPYTSIQFTWYILGWDSFKQYKYRTRICPSIVETESMKGISYKLVSLIYTFQKSVKKTRISLHRKLTSNRPQKGRKPMGPLQEAAYKILEPYD